jgi:hypothetical protein
VAKPKPEPRAALEDLPSVSPSTTIESAAQNALIDRVNDLSNRLTGAGQQLIQSGTLVASSNAGASIRITYPIAFASPARILAQISSGGDMFVQPPDPAGSGASATFADLILRRITDGSAIVNSAAVRVEWIAVGTRAA